MTDSQVWNHCSNLSIKLVAGVVSGVTTLSAWMILFGATFARPYHLLNKQICPVKKACLCGVGSQQYSLLWLGFGNSCCSYLSFLLSRPTMPICKADQAADFQYCIKDHCLLSFFLSFFFPHLLCDSPCPSKVDWHCFLPLWAFSLCCCCLNRPALLLSALSFNSLGDWVENAACHSSRRWQSKDELKRGKFTVIFHPPKKQKQ